MLLALPPRIKRHYTKLHGLKASLAVLALLLASNAGAQTADTIAIAE